ncbi:MAG: hypothetical protein NTW19_20155 [Planctomycetota bacterium]|nr:hypothetical protein [Planctomycetota bacterium]
MLKLVATIIVTSALMPLMDFFTYRAVGVSAYPLTAILMGAVWVGGAVLLGAARVNLTHPRLSRGYSEWLATVPWEYGKPLPLGSVLPTVFDGLMVLFFTGLIVLTQYAYPAAVAGCVVIIQTATPEQAANFHWIKDHLWLAPFLPVVAYAVGYGSAASFALSVTKITPRALLVPAVLVPLCFYPGGPSLARTAAVATVILVVGVCWMIQCLKRFPWDAPDWNRPIKEIYLEASIRAKHLGWPHLQVGPWRKSEDPIGWPLKLALSGLAAWWLLALGEVLSKGAWTHEGGRPMTEAEQAALAAAVRASFTFGLPCLISMSRLLIYFAEGSPPISLWGRLRTGQLVIPGYDVMFVAPLCILAVGGTLPLLLFQLNVPGLFVLAINVFVVLLIEMGMGPSLEAWTLTGLNGRRRPGARISSIERAAMQGRGA